MVAQLGQVAGRVVGIDFSRNMIQIASERFPSLEFEVADAEEVPFDDEEFDVVVSCYTAHHFARPGVVFEEARRVLQPNGRVAVIMPVQSEQKSFGAFYQSALEEIPPEDAPGGPLLNASDPDEVGQVLEAAGFADVAADKRVKPTRLATIDQLLRSGWAFLGLDSQPQSVQDRIRARTIERAEPFKQQDGSYDFPDVVIVASGTK